MPSVTFIPSDYNEKITFEVQAFNSNGKSFKLSAISEPTSPTVVISQNERTDNNERVFEAFLPQNQEKIPLFLNQDSIIEDRSLRSNGDPEKLYIFNCFNLNAIEGWLAGSPEIRFTAMSNLIPNLRQDYLPEKPRSAFGGTSWLIAKRTKNTNP